MLAFGFEHFSFILEQSHEYQEITGCICTLCQNEAINATQFTFIRDRYGLNACRFFYQTVCIGVFIGGIIRINRTIQNNATLMVSMWIGYVSKCPVLMITTTSANKNKSLLLQYTQRYFRLMQ